MSPVEICPGCGKTGGTLWINGCDGPDGIAWRWHPLCWGEFRCWIRGHDDLCVSPEKCAKRFIAYRAGKRERP